MQIRDQCPAALVRALAWPARRHREALRLQEGLELGEIGRGDDRLAVGRHPGVQRLAVEAVDLLRRQALAVHHHRDLRRLVDERLRRGGRAGGHGQRGGRGGESPPAGRGGTYGGSCVPRGVAGVDERARFRRRRGRRCRPAEADQERVPVDRQQDPERFDDERYLHARKLRAHDPSSRRGKPSTCPLEGFSCGASDPSRGSGRRSAARPPSPAHRPASPPHPRADSRARPRRTTSPPLRPRP